MSPTHKPVGYDTGLSTCFDVRHSDGIVKELHKWVLVAAPADTRAGSAPSCAPPLAITFGRFACDGDITCAGGDQRRPRAVSSPLSVSRAVLVNTRDSDM